ncbi:MAG: hypothetical protein HKO59_17100, partial [Phycisphaerales bacterium]|nr:hypothetical protein [Phycisphaerae bacterium]NNM27668.1 hypothetical protein [Phycisphaerales bacterium]
HLALATCRNLPSWEADDRFLHDALRAAGVSFDVPVWSDPAVDWTRYDVCLIRTTWDYQDRREEFLVWAERVSVETMLLNPLPIVRWNSHKSYLRDLSVRGVATAPTEWLLAGTRADVAGLMAARGWERGFLKPAVGATARETMRFEAEGETVAAAQTHVDRLLPNEDLLLQPYLDQVESAGERSAIFIDGVLSHCVRKIPVPGDYRVQDDFGASDEPVRLTAHERDLAERAVTAVPEPLLYARVDMLRGLDGTPCVTELELIEPSLFFRHDPAAAQRLATGLIARTR